MQINRRQALTTLAALAAAGRPTHAQDDDVRLRAVLAAPHRSAANMARDAARHPYETLRFFNLRPMQQVVELSPGGGWYTEILAPYLREQGRLFVAGEVGLLPRRTPAFTDIAPSGGADLVLTFRNVHNWLEAGHLDATLQAVAAVLKPGGVLGVEEHRAPPGRSRQWIDDNGYVPEELLIERARAAELLLDARSEINANPRDTKDHPNGVWSLPPTLRGGEVDKAKYLAIGESDRFTHRYVKRG